MWNITDFVNFLSFTDTPIVQGEKADLSAQFSDNDEPFEPVAIKGE